MQLFAIILFISFSLSALALAEASADNACWQNEYNPLTKAVYESDAVYQEQLADWKATEPESAHPLKLMTAYNVYKNEKDKSLSLGNDKMAHCYIGCRIHQKTDARTMTYVGWYKEMQDITDCKKATHFEEEDFLATISGAEVNSSSAAKCVEFCQEEWSTP